MCHNSYWPGRQQYLLKALGGTLMQLYITFSIRETDIHKIFHPGINDFPWNIIPFLHLPGTTIHFHQTVLVSNRQIREQEFCQLTATNERTAIYLLNHFWN